MERILKKLSIIDGLTLQRVSLTINLFGENRTINGTITQYSKPFIKITVGSITRIFNENIVKEIIPL